MTWITKTQKDRKLKNETGNNMKFQNLKLEKEREREYLRHGGSMGAVLREEVVWVADLGVRVSDFESFRVSEWVTKFERAECLRVRVWSVWECKFQVLSGQKCVSKTRFNKKH